MDKKIIGILICFLLMTTTLPVVLGVLGNEDGSAMVSIRKNDPPVPPVITGPHYGKVNTLYTFSVGDITDPDGDQLYVFLDWGDGNYSGWLGPYVSEPTIIHSWSKPGNYSFRIKIKDIWGAVSNWSTPFWIEIVRLHLAGYLGSFESINQTDDLIVFHSQTFFVFPAFPVINKEGIIVLSKKSLGYLGTTSAFGIGGISIL